MTDQPSSAEKAEKPSVWLTCDEEGMDFAIFGAMPNFDGRVWRGEGILAVLDIDHDNPGYTASARRDLRSLFGGKVGSAGIVKLVVEPA